MGDSFRIVEVAVSGQVNLLTKTINDLLWQPHSATSLLPKRPTKLKVVPEFHKTLRTKWATVKYDQVQPVSKNDPVITEKTTIQYIHNILITNMIYIFLLTTSGCDLDYVVRIFQHLHVPIWKITNLQNPWPKCPVQASRKSTVQSNFFVTVSWWTWQISAK